MLPLLNTSDGSLAVIYTPVSHTLTVAMGNFAGPVTARWFDPTNATFQTVAGSPFPNSGSHNFTTPGNNSAGDPDWVLLLQAASGSPTPTPTATRTPTPQLLNTDSPTATYADSDSHTPTATAHLRRPRQRQPLLLTPTAPLQLRTRRRLHQQLQQHLRRQSRLPQRLQ